MEPERIKIVHCIGSMPRAGCELHLSRLIEYLTRADFDQTLVLTKSGGELLPAVRASGCRVFELGFEQKYSRYDPRAYVDAVSALGRFAMFLRRSRPEILHAHLFWANVLGVVAGRIAGVPCIITSRRQLGIFKQSKKLHRSIENFTNRFVDRILVNSEAVRRDVNENECNVEGKTYRIYNGVAFSPARREEVASARVELDIGDNDAVLLAVGNLRKLKGHGDLIDAFALLAPRFERLKLLIAGADRGMFAVLARRIGELGLDGRVRLLGARSDIPVLLSLCDVFVHPSHEEGFSNAVLEAMLTGKPVVATDVGGTPEAVADGISGLLVPPGNAREMADAIARLLADEQLGKSLGTAARSRALEEFSFERVARQYQEFYESLCAGVEPQHEAS